MPLSERYPLVDQIDLLRRVLFLSRLEVRRVGPHIPFEHNETLQNLLATDRVWFNRAQEQVSRVVIRRLGHLAIDYCGRIMEGGEGLLARARLAIEILALGAEASVLRRQRDRLATRMSHLSR